MDKTQVGSLKEFTVQHGGSWVGETRRRQWHPTPVLLPGKSHGWRSLVGCSPWPGLLSRPGRKRRPSARENGGVSGVSSSCGARGGFLPRHDYFQIFPGSSSGKESTCDAGDPCSIPGSGRSSGERIGYPLQYSWASLVVQLVKNPPAMQETWVRSLG